VCGGIVIVGLCVSLMDVSVWESFVDGEGGGSELVEFVL